MGGKTAGPILLVSPRWQTRALLAAELGERVERDVVSAADVDEALGLIKLVGVDPAVIVIDAGRRMAPEDVERLLEAKSGTDVVLVVSGLRRGAFARLRQRCAGYLMRPVSIGAIADGVVRVLAGQGTGR
jgi:DNA-binding NarL/FixJ family response regulator